MRQIALLAVLLFVTYSLYLEAEGNLSEGTLWLLVSVLFCGDLILSLLPSPAHEGGGSMRDQVIHFVAYASLSAALLFAAVWRRGRGPGPFPNGAATIVLAIVAFGAGIEVLQGLLGRDAEILDATANAGGSITGLLVWRAVVAGAIERTR